jgi:hypothetical protein
MHTLHTESVFLSLSHTGEVTASMQQQKQQQDTKREREGEGDRKQEKNFRGGGRETGEDGKAEGVGRMLHEADQGTIHTHTHTYTYTHTHTHTHTH